MKNKVLRLAVVAMLVVAMVLTMAACKNDNPDPSPSTNPTQSTKPSESTAPSESAKPSESTAPTEEVKTDAEKLKEAYGIEFVGAAATYGDTNGLVIKGIDELLEAHPNLKVTVKVNYIDYEGNGSKPNKPTATEVFESTDKTQTGGDESSFLTAVYSSSTSATKITETAGTNNKLGYYYKLDGAGTYTVSINVKITAANVTFAKYGIAAEDTQEFEVEASASVAKKAVTITVYDNAIQVADAETTVSPSLIPVSTTTSANVIFSDSDSDSDAEGAFNSAISGYTKYVVAANSYKSNVEGAYKYNFVLLKNDKSIDEMTEDNVLAVEDVVTANYTYTAVSGTEYRISAYDMNVIRDVNTSVDEINVTNTVEKYALAKNRYEALSDAQKAWYKNPNNTLTSLGLTLDTGSIYYTTVTATNAGKATSVPAFFTAYDETAAADAKQQKLDNEWAALVKSSNWTVYGDTEHSGAGFNVNDTNAMKAFNALDAFVTANEYSKVSNEYTAYTKAATFVDTAKATSVKELIAGAVGAYNQAIANGAKVIYGTEDSGTVSKYISNAEVKALTNQAKEAYDKLDQTLGTFVEDAKVDKTNLNSITTYDAALTALVAMNNSVATMEEVVNYVNIENYANYASTHNGTDVYARLYNLVYGKTPADAATTTDFFGKNTDMHNAMSDIIAISEDYEEDVVAKVVAEYKAWIDLTLAYEAQKAEAIAQFDALIAEEFTAENDYTAAEIATATGKSSAAYKAIVKAIMTETNPTAVFVAEGDYDAAGEIKTPDAYVSKAGNIVKKNFAAIVSSAGSFEEAKELFAEAFNVDNAFSLFSKTYLETAHP